MTPEYHLVSRASNLGRILLKGDDSEIMGCADEILLFLNHLQESIEQNPKSNISLASFGDIPYRLESEPEAALRDKEVCTRLLDLFAMVARH